MLCTVLKKWLCKFYKVPYKFIIIIIIIINIIIINNNNNNNNNNNILVHNFTCFSQIFVPMG